MNGSNYFTVSYTHVCKILEKFVVKHWSYGPLKFGGSIWFFKKANFKARKRKFVVINNDFKNPSFNFRMLSFKSNKMENKELTGSELNKIKYHIKWPKILQNNYLFVIFYKTETRKVSKFLLLSNLDCKKYIYANKILFYLSRSSFKAKLFCRILLGLTV